MPEPACAVFDEHLTEYDFGPSHPMAPLRIDLTIALARELGVVGDDALPVVGASAASDDLLATVHTPDYIEAVREVSARPYEKQLAYGLGNDDNPTFAHMHDASALIVGASVEAARRVWTGENRRAVNITGGLHHAMPGNASGFCIYNDCAVAIRWLLANGASKVAYIDVDAHHGDGVQEVFYNDPRVLTVSLHETPQTLFPGTGAPSEIGGPDAEGSAVNVAIPPGTSDAGWLRAFHAVVPQVVAEFAPDIIVSQHGCDSHADDPLTNLMLSIDGQRASYLALRDLATTVPDGRWIALGGGGYAVLDVVPRIWTHLLAIVGERPIDPETPTPPQWRQRVHELSGRDAPLRMTDAQSISYRDWTDGYDPATWLDRSIMATRKESFPLLGLDPMP
ncbi:acetoin utilization protein AcuC [Solicola gregarius]|uniref:Acetoin utilization protein AcuC n=1 Tax=Solicola gregarius TaxID=2908642 RepID=A0AA46TKV6_9ACTN|nr:acetoin utilization protein AcuC [Solicola gregarius]UYM06950.1 acetoin utilization protein AcuC [Solicola gregarius]